MWAMAAHLSGRDQTETRTRVLPRLTEGFPPSSRNVPYVLQFSFFFFWCPLFSRLSSPNKVTPCWQCPSTGLGPTTSPTSSILSVARGTPAELRGRLPQPALARPLRNWRAPAVKPSQAQVWGRTLGQAGRVESETPEQHATYECRACARVGGVRTCLWGNLVGLPGHVLVWNGESSRVSNIVVVARRKGQSSAQSRLEARGGS